MDYVLFDRRIGYCEYHASAMAVLLRAAGIPSRVAVGYHQVEFDPTAEAFTYRESDAHAWVEAFFPGYGWIPFEPTPSEPLREYGPDESDAEEALTLPTSTPTPQPDETPIPTEEVNAGEQPNVDTSRPGDQRGDPDRFGRWGLAGLDSLGDRWCPSRAFWSGLVCLEQTVSRAESGGRAHSSDGTIWEVVGSPR